jgi:hypothetical protein
MSFAKGLGHHLHISRKLILIILVVMSLTVIVASASIAEAGPAGGGSYCPGC